MQDAKTSSVWKQRIKRAFLVRCFQALQFRAWQLDICDNSYSLWSYYQLTISAPCCEGIAENEMIRIEIEKVVNICIQDF